MSFSLCMYVDQNNKLSTYWYLLFIDVLGLALAIVLSTLVVHSVEYLQDSAFLFFISSILLLNILITLINPRFGDFLDRGYLIEFYEVVRRIIKSFSFFILLTFFSKTSIFFSRLLTGISFLVTIVIVYILRVIAKHVIRNLLSSDVDLKTHLFIIANTEDAVRSIAENALNDANYSVEIAGLACVSKQNESNLELINYDQNNDIISIDDALNYITTHVVDIVYISQNAAEKIDNKFLELIVGTGATLYIGINHQLSSHLPNTELYEFSDKYHVRSSYTVVSSTQLFLKRMLDIVASLVGLVFTGIAFIIFGPIIYFQSPGPIIFKQTRIGQNGRKFIFYKFRSMYQDAEKRKQELMDQNEMQGLMFKMENDPRITPIGRFLRRTSIDELPQFYNILRGEMSLVGTRPPTEDEFLQYDPHYKIRLSMKPGLTGNWQVSGRSDITNFDDVVKLDMDYIDGWNLSKDIKIILKTVKIVLLGRGAI